MRIVQIAGLGPGLLLCLACDGPPPDLSADDAKLGYSILSPEDMEMAGTLGATRIMQKPVSPPDLVKVVAEVLEAEKQG